MKLAIAIKDLGPSQLNFLLIQQVNKLVDSRADIDVVALYENVCRTCLPMSFASMQIVEGWAFDGPIVATTISTASKILYFPCSKKKLFYTWDLDWLRMPQRSFRQLLPIYGNPELTLLARSADHANIIRQCFNRTALVVEDFNIDRIIEEANV